MTNLVAVSAVCGALTGGLSYISATHQIKKQMKIVNQMAAENGGRIPTGGMNKDGALWDGYTTPDEVKATYNKARLKATASSAAMGAVLTFALNYGLVLAKKLIKK